MKQLNAVIFDVDGTLAETERDAHRVAFNRAFEMVGLGWYWDVATYGELLAVSGGKERLHFHLSQLNLGSDEQRQIELTLPTVHKLKTRFYSSMVENGLVQLRPGVRRLIDAIRQQGWKLAIASTSSPTNVTALIQHTLDPDAVTWFDVIATGDAVSNKKPAPDIYQYCLNQLGLNAAECIAIEDSQQGAEAATQAGITTLVTPSFYTQQQDFSQAFCVVDCLGDAAQSCHHLSGYPVQSYIDIQTLKELHEQAHH